MKNLKALTENRADLYTQLTAITEKADVEVRALSDEERTSFEKLEKDIKDIDVTIAIEERTRGLGIKSATAPAVEERAAAEERAFTDFLRDIVSENRADVNLTFAANGAVVPTSIATKIITKVVDICPIYAKATRYNVGGTLQIPYYDESAGSITMAYADEGTPAESTSGKFANIELKGYLGRALTKISKSLMNNSQFDILNFVINQMSISIAKFLEKELLKGTVGKIDGLKGVTQTITAASATAVTGDELIKLKDLVKDVFQNDTMFIMSSATRTAIRLLKDGQQRYLLQDDITSPFGTTLLGKPVFVSDNMDEMAAGKTAIFYGDFSGLAVKIAEDINIQILREKYAEEHMDGVLAFVEADSKVENAQKLAKLVMKAV